MKIQKIRTINGPNVYHHRPVLVTTLDLEDLAEVGSHELPGFTERMLESFPGLQEHRCSVGRPGGFVERLKRGTYFAHIVEHLALELSQKAGIPVGFGKAIYGGSPGIYQVITRFQSEEAMKYLVQAAVSFAEALAQGERLEIQSRIEEAKEIVARNELGPSTRAILDAADRRGIPWIRLNDLNLVQLGFGKNRKLIQATTSSLTSDIAVDIACDKSLTKRFLEQAGIRVPWGTVARSEWDALEAFRDLGRAVAIKPLDGHQGQGVCLKLGTEEEVREAFRIASEYCSRVVIEEYFEGKDYRVVVVGGRMIAAAERVPAHVIGDGKCPISELIERENQNPLRGEGHEKPMTRIEIDEVSRAYLNHRGIRLDQVPEAGERIFLRPTANLSTGGSAMDVTEQVHPEIQFVCERAARIIGLDICGVDLVLEDISKPLSKQDGAIVEVNAGPGIRMHHFPAQGKPRDVGAAIVDWMFPEGNSGRIPIVSVTGTNGKTTVTRLIHYLLVEQGVSAGMTTTDGIFVGRNSVMTGDTTGPVSARTILCDPGVEVAVLETARGGIVRRGLGYDWSDVGVITNIQEDHLGQDGIESVEDILWIKSLVAERVRPGGTVVLNADDEFLARLPENPSVGADDKRIVYFSLRSDHILLRRHAEKGGTVFFLKEGWIYERTGREEKPLLKAADIPLTLAGTAGFHIANCLAAIAATRALGIEEEKIAALKTFQPLRDNLGRSNIYRVGPGYLMLDYGHNPAAFQAVCEMARQWNGRRVTGVIAVPGDRSNEMIAHSGRAAARGFDRLVIREDEDLRGRLPGETAELLMRAAREANPKIECVLEVESRAAFDRALREMKEGEIVVFFYDDLAHALAWLDQHGAIPVEDASEIGMNQSNRFLEVG